MNYIDFVRAVAEEVNRQLEGGVRASIYSAEKNNSTEKTGILIESPGINISPTIYLEEYYESYLKGNSLADTADDVINFFNLIRRKQSWDEESILTYEGVKEKIVFKLVNTEKNRDYLEGVPHLPFMDLSIVFYVLLEVNKEGTAAMNVLNEHLQLWNVDTDILWEDAVVNCRKLLPAEFFTMEHALREMIDYESDCGDDRQGMNLFEENALNGDGMYVLTNKYRSNGAACIAYPHITEMLGRIIRSDYYILPSSVHELIIMPYSEVLNCNDINAMIREINATQVADEEVLSDHVYYYDRKTGKVSADKEGGCGTVGSLKG